LADQAADVEELTEELRRFLQTAVKEWEGVLEPQTLPTLQALAEAGLPLASYALTPFLGPLSDDSLWLLENVLADPQVGVVYLLLLHLEEWLRRSPAPEELRPGLIGVLQRWSAGELEALRGSLLDLLGAQETG
jgi:hypothetical protein